MLTPAPYMKYRHSVFTVLDGLEQRLERLVDSLKDSSHWTWESEEGIGARALTESCNALLTLDYDDEDTDTDQAIASVLSVNEKILAEVEAVNQAKRMLKQSFLEITNERVWIDGERKPLAQAILADMGRARLHRQHAYRQLFAIDGTPSHIGFSRSYIRTVARKTNTQVLAWLSKMTQENTESYRNTIAGMNSDEPLALVKGRYNSQRANVCVDGEWLMMPAHLPLFIPPCDSKAVTIKPPPLGKNKSRAVRARSDERLVANPLFTIGAISVYRYEAQ